MKFLVNFVRKNNFIDFAIAEFESLCSLYKIPYKLYSQEKSILTKPLLYVDLPPQFEILDEICKRSVSIKNIIKVYSEGLDLPELIKAVDVESFQKDIEQYKTFKFIIDYKNKSIKPKERTEIIEEFKSLPIYGKVNLDNPELIFTVIDSNGEKYFGKIECGRVDDDPRYFSNFSLDKREYLGPTSTDNTLAFIMTNLAEIQKGDMFYDPFVGTGSLLIPGSYFGASAFGSDIDIRVLKGYSVGYSKNLTQEKKSNIFSNFLNYNLPIPNIIRCDVNNSPLTQSNNFDSILSDPPYGDRAFSRKSGLSDDKRIKHKDKLIANNKEEFFTFPALTHVSISTNFENLLNLGDRCVRLNGKLVFLYPTKKENLEECERPIAFPQHPSFVLQHACENRYSLYKSRWCLVYRKVK